MATAEALRSQAIIGLVSTRLPFQPELADQLALLPGRVGARNRWHLDDVGAAEAKDRGKDRRDQGRGLETNALVLIDKLIFRRPRTGREGQGVGEVIADLTIERGFEVLLVAQVHAGVSIGGKNGRKACDLQSRQEGLGHVEAVGIVALLVEIEGTGDPIELATLLGDKADVFDERVRIDLFLEVEGHDRGQDGVQIEVPTGLGLGKDGGRGQVRKAQIILNRGIVAVEINIHREGEIALGDIAALGRIIERRVADLIVIAGDHEGRVQLIVRLPTQGATNAPIISGVGVLAAVCTGIVHPAIFVAHIADQTHGQLVLDQRHIDHAAQTQTIGVALGLARFNVKRGVIAARIGLVGHITDRARQGAGSEQGALGSAQNLNTTNIVGTHVWGQDRERGQGQVIQIDGHQLLLAAAAGPVRGLDAAHNELVEVGATGGDHARDGASQIFIVLDALGFEILAADSGDALWNILNRLSPLGGGHDHFFDHI